MSDPANPFTGPTLSEAELDEVERAMTAPAQDDDPEKIIAGLKEVRDNVGRLLSVPGYNRVQDAIDFLERLSPTPDTGLIEALTAMRMAFSIPNVSEEVKQDALDRCDRALANAAPAQPESDMRNTLRTVEFRLALSRITERYPPDTIAGRLAADVLAKYPNRYENADREKDCEPFPIPEIEGLLLGGEGVTRQEVTPEMCAEATRVWHEAVDAGNLKGDEIWHHIFTAMQSASRPNQATKGDGQA